MKTNFKFKMVLILVIAPALVLGFCAEVRGVITYDATITDIKNPSGVKVLPSGSVEWVNAYVGMTVKAGDGVRTYANSGVEITLYDGTWLKFAEHTDFFLKTYETTSNKFITMSGEAGSIRRVWANFKSMIGKKQNFTIATPSGASGVKGTDFCLTDDNYTFEAISTLSGEVKASMISWSSIDDSYFVDPYNKCLDTLDFDYVDYVSSYLGLDPVDILGRDFPVTIPAGYHSTSEYGSAFSSPISGISESHLDYATWVPEPATLLLLGLGGLMLFRRRRCS